MRQLVLVEPERSRQAMGMVARLVRHAAGHRQWVPQSLLRSLAGMVVSKSLAVPSAKFRLRSVHPAMMDHTMNKRTRLDRQTLADITSWAALTRNG